MQDNFLLLLVLLTVLAAAPIRSNVTKGVGAGRLNALAILRRR